KSSVSGLQRAAMRFRQSTCNRKTETETAVASMNGRIPLLERRKNPRECVCRNTDPGIAHFDDQSTAFLTARDDRNLTAFWGELQRVPNQIRENLFEPARIGSDIATRSLQPEVDTNPHRFLLALEILEYEADHLVRVHLHELQPQGLVRNMGEVEQLGDSVQHT